MTSILHAHSPTDFLALIPHLAGYTPRDSVVLVPFRGSRTAGTLRFDLPAEAADHDVFAATAIGTLCRIPDIDGVAIIVYEHGRAVPGSRAALITSLRVCADACSLHAGEALWVTDECWGSFIDHALGGDVSEIRPHAPLDLPTPRADQAAGTRLPHVGKGRRRRVAHALATIDDAVVALRGAAHGTRGSITCVDPRALAAVELLDDLGALWEGVVADAGSRTDGGEYDVAALLWALSRPLLRDAALASWCHGRGAGEQVLEANLRWANGAPAPGDSLFLAGQGERPDVGRLLSAHERLRHLAASAEGEHRVAALATLAWVSWALGRGTHADAYAQRALRQDPDHTLAQIVARLTATGRLPDWAFQRTAEPA